MPIESDTSTNENCYGQQRVHKNSGWASAAAITVTVIIVGVVFTYLAAHSR